MMKHLIVAACLALPLVAVAAEEKKMSAQQTKMASCNKDAKDKSLEGDARKTFMSECLKAKPAAASSQQDKMKSCNKDAGAKSLKGDERKKFMSECLKA
jgi:psiF repeat